VSLERLQEMADQGSTDLCLYEASDRRKNHSRPCSDSRDPCCYHGVFRAHPVFAYSRWRDPDDRGPVPGPLAFCVFRQQHGSRVPATAIDSEGQPERFSCYWPKATNAGGLGAVPPRGMQADWYISQNQTQNLRGRGEKVRKNRMSLIRDTLTQNNYSAILRKATHPCQGKFWTTIPETVHVGDQTRNVRITFSNRSAALSRSAVSMYSSA